MGLPTNLFSVRQNLKVHTGIGAIATKLGNALLDQFVRPVCSLGGEQRPILANHFPTGPLNRFIMLFFHPVPPYYTIHYAAFPEGTQEQNTNYSGIPPIYSQAGFATGSKVKAHERALRNRVVEPRILIASYGSKRRKKAYQKVYHTATKATRRKQSNF
jgi:hypothetical protein